MFSHLAECADFMGHHICKRAVRVASAKQVSWEDQMQREATGSYIRNGRLRADESAYLRGDDSDCAANPSYPACANPFKGLLGSE
ncbi:hypothetical protein GUITHDRAFT_113123 [Guillardia theta CCMP2712]|uniref:Uncharacterized protein n=1 Tax=Guillardia theta (strain CCMP2712) TaxID=905079 RepID=L1IXQ3_GUITC|nr:hypothetical protein GUITHDRAFT_113123 [Guillardia theta CCMP2712]EKX40862.1 hypothetical protein GUITHDRAFT_113123 [Guillardia theta CCMP2712]|eukprot:XP_005827842.1 hypothetical protein GUITHDRAFT_113123 [Guillardia theta CCMP2712]